jgi:D-lactate dehydrogenase
MSIVFYDVEDWERELLPETLAGRPVKIVAERLTPLSADKASGAEAVSVFSWSTIDSAVLDHLPDVRHIATRSTGVDHIDMPACRKRGITVSNVPEYGVRTVAEHTFALMLALSRKILHCDNRTKQCDFSRDGLRGFDLEGKTLGIVGCGKIGSAVAEIGRAFAMHVVVYDQRRNAELAGRLGFSYVDSLDDLLRQSDVVSLHVPLTDETRGMINERSLSAIKPGALLINTARGDLVKTTAVLEALNTGKLAGAGLDVLENEKLIRDEAEVLASEVPSQEHLSSLLHSRIMLTNPKVIITPHNAFNSEEAVCKITETTIKNVEAYFAGAARNLVEG